MGNSWARARAALCVLAVAASACGEDVYCPDEVVVAIVSPTEGEDIAQTIVDVRVRSNLARGDRATLTVTNGDAVAELEATADSDGDIVFTDVPIGAGDVTLHVRGTNSECGATGESQISFRSAGEATCQLAFRQAPVLREYYAPVGVLNRSVDASPAIPDFQGQIDVTTGVGLSVELLVNDIEVGSEVSQGTTPAGDDGTAVFGVTLGQGRKAVRALCRFGNGTIAAATPSYQVFVDTEAPGCSLDSPAEGQALFPAQDEDDQTPGTQITLSGTADGGQTNDVLGEPSVFAIGSALLAGSLVDIDGTTSVQTTFTAPNVFDIDLTVTDHAGNTCTAGHAHPFVTDGCSIELVSPLGVVASDANGIATDGVQVDMTVQVGTECAGQVVTTDCGLGQTMQTVPPNGTTMLRVTMCTNPVAQCDVADTCTTRVTDTLGFTTSFDATIEVDTLPPLVGLTFDDPDVDAQGNPMGCGRAVVQAQDVSPNPGMQMDVVVVSPLAAQRWVSVFNTAMGTTIVSAGPTGNARITIGSGANNVVAIARDEHGNEAQTMACTVDLADLVVGYRADIADGLVGSVDGSVNGPNLTLDICGTVSEANASVAVSIDGAPAAGANVTGTTWCLPGVTLSEGFHTVDATAVGMTSIGIAPTLSLEVDLTGPGSISSLMLTAPTRQSVRASWIAGGDGPNPVAGYRIKVAQVPLTDANFDTTGVVVAGPAPLPMGSPQAVTINQLRPGQLYYVGVAALDAAGNRSVAQSEGPAIPDFDLTGAFTAPQPADGDNGLGYSMARGRFNGDAYWDLAVSAPYKGAGHGAVYIYFGGPNGIGATPDVTIQGTVPSAQLGNAVAVVRWSAPMRHDLVVSAPFDDAVYVYDAATIAAAPATIDEGDADLVIGVSNLPPMNYFTFSAIGWHMAAADFDGDGTDDLIMSAVAGGGGNGGVAVLYGGSPTGSPVLLHDANDAEMNGAVVHLIDDPQPANFDLFGQWVFNLGRTGGVVDARDDLGIAYAENDRVYMIRGRAQPATPGVHALVPAFGQDLVVIDNSTDGDGNVQFGATMASIEDMNGDGGRDVIIGSPLEGANAGRVVIIDGNDNGLDPGNGSAGVRTIGNAATDPFTIARIAPQGVARLGVAIPNNASSVDPDIDGDGLEDLAIVARDGPNDIVMLIWFGGSLPVGNVTSTTAAHDVHADASFNAATPPSGGVGFQAIWSGDVNADGLIDICWSDSVSNALDGGFEVLWDDGL